ncbi:MAG TPA: carbamoyl-phosphate synthase large subunit, partial [Methanomassiliicoccaceae archaeon]|nr:carbamoyl-phosphate synthase large subunit [Methanomassiliicoccaceae archaeon]
ADKPEILDVARQLSRMGFHIYATRGTSTYLREHGLQTTTVYTISQKMDPDALGLMRRGKINLIINTPTNSSGARRDGYMMRRLAVELEIPFLTTVQAARATVSAMRKAAAGRLEVMDLATHHRAASLERPQC